jgi:hypothetical protein
MLSFFRRRPAALVVIGVLVALAAAVPTWCAVSGTWGW